jgi:tripartite-type tricarboxylate transporter receptor subunit TctC
MPARRAIKAALLLACLGVGIALAPNAARPEAARTIKVVISVPPGGTIDLLVRTIADYLGRTRGQTIVVESRPGAGSIIAAESVARAAPDGTTLLVNSNGQMISPLIRKVNFDPRTSFEPICFLVDSPQVLVVNSKSPYRTLRDLVDAARARPGELSISTVGPLTTQHIAVERFKRIAGIDLTYVPFTGGAPAINALLGGHVTAVLQNFSEAGEQVHAGTLRALATPSRSRIPPLPEVPTIAESGYKDFVAEVWFGLVAPAKTPQPIITQYIDWFGGAIEAPEVKAKLTAVALYPNRRCGADFAAHIQRQVDEFTRVITELKLKG